MATEKEMFDRVVMEDVWNQIRTMWISTNENLTDLLVLFYAKGDESLRRFIQGEQKAFLIRLRRKCEKDLARKEREKATEP